jgi:hypothetical protein
MKMAAFWVVAPCSLVEVYRRFRGTCCLHALMMEAASTAETPVNFYQTTRRYNPEDAIFVIISVVKGAEVWSCTLCCRYVRIVVVRVPAGQCCGAPPPVLRTQFLRVASEARFVPYLSVQCRHAVQQRVRQSWVHTGTSSQHLKHNKPIPHISVGL